MLPDRYKKLGFTGVGVKKKAPNNASHKWEVIAHKDGKYKKITGGYRGMQDFTQHKDKDRQKRFWDRMGGKNSAKAKDPFSPLYWHKRFGTWQTGGNTNMKNNILYDYATSQGFDPDELMNDYFTSSPYEQLELMSHIMQVGGQIQEQQNQGGQDEQIIQLIQAFSQLTQKDPEEIIQRLQQANPEQQQQIIQNMVQFVQQAQSQEANESQEQEQQEPVQESPELEQEIAQYGYDAQSLLGYSNVRNNPFINNPYNLIRSNKITMAKTGKRLLGISDTGDTKIMEPYSGDYEFDGNSVLEIPYGQTGLNSEINSLEQELAKAKKDNELKLKNAKTILEKRQAAFDRAELLKKESQILLRIKNLKEGRVVSDGGFDFVRLPNDPEFIEKEINAIKKEFSSINPNKAIVKNVNVKSNDGGGTFVGPSAEYLQLLRNRNKSNALEDLVERPIIDTNKIKQGTNSSNTNKPNTGSRNNIDYKILNPPKLDDYLKDTGLKNTTEFQMQAMSLRKTNPDFWNSKVQEAIKNGWAKTEQDVIDNLRDGKLGRITQLFIEPTQDSSVKAEMELLKPRQGTFTSSLEGRLPEAVNSIKNLANKQDNEIENPTYKLRNGRFFNNLINNFKLQRAFEPIALPYIPSVDAKVVDAPFIDPRPYIQNIRDQYGLTTANINSNSSTGQAVLAGLAAKQSASEQDVLNQLAAKNQAIDYQNRVNRAELYNKIIGAKNVVNSNYTNQLQQTQANADYIQDQALANVQNIYNQQLAEDNAFDFSTQFNPYIENASNLFDKILGRKAYRLNKKEIQEQIAQNKI